MSNFQLLDERRYPLNVRQAYDDKTLPYYRWEHRLTLGHNGRQFVVFIDALVGQAYCEETTKGELEVVLESGLWNELVDYAQDNGYLSMIMDVIPKPTHMRQW
jgi:hypothetical protein